MCKRNVSSSLVIALLAAACGGGSSGGSSTVTGLSTPSQLDIVTPSNTTAAPAFGGSIAPGAEDPGFAAGSEYYTDEASVHVYDPALEPLQTINKILCFMGQTGAGELVNEPPFTAQVNVSECEDGGNQSSAASSSGQSSGGNAEEIQIWTVSSERANDSSPHEVGLWVPGDFGPDSTIFVDVDVTESVSEMNPFGSFSMSFASAVDVSGLATPDLYGALATIGAPALGDIGFTFIEDRGDIDAIHAPGDDSHRVQVRVEMTDDTSAGWAHILSTERSNFGNGDSGQIVQEFEVAFDDTHFMRATDAGAPTAYERDSFTENVWNYNLYYADGPDAGARVDRNAGFGFRTEDDAYGWAGYYGAWVPDGVSLDSGDVVSTEVFGQQASEEIDYTVFRAPGRLIRFTKQTLALTEIGSQTFEWWTWDSMTNQSVIYLVQYFDNTSEWKKVAVVDPGSYQSTPVNPNEVIDTSVLGMLDMWSDGLGGRVVFVDGESSITFYAEEFVNGDDDVFTGTTVMTLYGFVQALAPEILQADAENGDVYLADAPDVVTPHEFEFRQTDLTLWLDTDGQGTFEAVGLGAGQVPTSGPNTWGMSSGPLVTPAVAMTLTDVWDAWNADEFYVYETGHNDWNMFFGLLDPLGGFVGFDKPLAITYQHSTDDDRNDDPTYDGQTFLLEYHGPGDLSGIPYEGVDLNGDSSYDRYYPVFSLDDGTMMTDSDGTNYVVKAIEVEQALAEDSGYTGSLTVTQAGGLVVPDLSFYTTPDIGAEPVVTDPPRVIGGEAVE